MYKYFLQGDLLVSFLRRPLQHDMQAVRAQLLAAQHRDQRALSGFHLTGMAWALHLLRPEVGAALSFSLRSLSEVAAAFA